MERIESTMGRNGRITIPAEIRRALGLRGGDFLRWEREGDHLIATPIMNGTQDPAVNGPKAEGHSALPADEADESVE